MSHPERQKAPAAALTEILRELQLDDWEIRPSEIEIMSNADGMPALLGKGAFGQVQAKMHVLCAAALSIAAPVLCM